jgi:pantoate--beta-alanine ligase
VSLSTVRTIAELRTRLDAARAGVQRVGFVPTMGYLHEGHASLLRAARRADDVVVLSIFVNPLQFAAGEDLDAYPRDLSGDTAMAAAAGTDVMFVPSIREMYPVPVLTTVSVGEVSAPLEGRSRPTHFDGVATVVTKLFAIVGPCRAYFGEKDFQQLAVVRRLVGDLSLPVEVVGCPTVREPDGLAMSSRNAYLSPDDRAAAPVLHLALEAGRSAVEAGERDPSVVRAVMSDVVGAEPRVQLEYAEVVDPATLRVPERLSGEVRLLVAARVGPARLIDNVGATVGATASSASTEGGVT